jgi:2,3-bisphosphoglycerate-dependent phosphoglycerate mutase
MQLYFIRHAQSINNAHWGDDTYQESDDPELTKLAYSQTGCLARYLGENQKLDEAVTWNPQNRDGFGVTHIYTSLMVRAIGTAVPIAQAISLPLVAWPEIHETGGIFSRLPNQKMKGLPGKPRSYFENNFPMLQLPAWLDETGWWGSLPFEEHEQRQLRAETVWNELLARHGDKEGEPEHHVVLVSHGGFFMHLLTAALGIQMRRIQEFDHEYWFLMNNCGITRLDVINGRVLVMYVNRIDFLPSDLIT